MKKLNFYFVIGMIALLLSSCNTYVKVLEVTSVGAGIKKADKSIVFENDTLILTYNLWANKGIMYYTVYNKLNIPIYVDWKRSGYIYNLKKYCYWQEKMNGNERSTFIPPNSFVELPFPYTLMSGDVTTNYTTNTGNKVRIENVDFRNDKSVTKVKVNKTWKKSGQTTIFEKSFTDSDSPIKFRNFMTYSTNEYCCGSTNNENYVNTSFNVSKITEMNTKQFNGKFTSGIMVVKRGNKQFVKSVKIFDFPYKSNDRFYYNVFQQ